MLKRYGGGGHAWNMIHPQAMEFLLFYMKEKFEVSGFMNNEDQSYDINIISRIRNGLVSAICDQIVLPKMIIMVPDDNILQNIKEQHPLLHWRGLLNGLCVNVTN